MGKRSGYPSVEQFRTQIAPYALREVGHLRGVICSTRFPLNTEEWKASIAFTRNIDEFVGAISGYPNFFHGRPTTSIARPSGPVETGTEEWWRRQIANARPFAMRAGREAVKGLSLAAARLSWADVQPLFLHQRSTSDPQAPIIQSGGLDLSRQATHSNRTLAVRFATHWPIPR
jgi:hypothetical protein